VFETPFLCGMMNVAELAFYEVQCCRRHSGVHAAVEQLVDLCLRHRERPPTGELAPQRPRSLQACAGVERCSEPPACGVRHHRVLHGEEVPLTRKRRLTSGRSAAVTVQTYTLPSTPARRSSGVVFASILPLSINATLSAVASTSETMCVERFTTRSAARSARR
jgi:hypothetical protein